ncbi:MAG: cell division protein ZapA [Actinomycetota bacterium]
MAVVNLTVNGRVYDIACDDSQVARVQELGRLVDDRAQTLLASVGNVSDSRLLVMVGLMLADELAEAREELRRLNGSAEAIDALAGRIEGIARRLERA